MWAYSPEGRGSDIALPVLPEHLQGADYDDDPVEDVADWMIEGFLNLVSDYSPRFLAAEMTVFHPGLRVAGTLDIIVDLPGLAVGRAGRFIPGAGVRPCVDVKTGKYLSVDLARADRHVPPMPRGADADGRDHADARQPTAARSCTCGPSTPRGYRLMLISGADDAAAWNRFRRAVELHEGRSAAKAKPGKVCYPLRADGTIRQPLIADLDGEGYGRAIAPLVKAGIEDLEQLAAMDAGDCLADQARRRQGAGRHPGRCSPTTACTCAAKPPRQRRRRDMAVLDIQRRSQQIGRIRIGQQVRASPTARMRPERLSTFRFTTASKTHRRRHRGPVRRHRAGRGKGSSRSSRRSPRSASPSRPATR